MIVGILIIWNAFLIIILNISLNTVLNMCLKTRLNSRLNTLFNTLLFLPLSLSLTLPLFSFISETFLMFSYLVRNLPNFIVPPHDTLNKDQSNFESLTDDLWFSHITLVIEYPRNLSAILISEFYLHYNRIKELFYR